MDEDSIARYIAETFAGVDVVVSSGDSFFFYNPDKGQPPDHRLPFVTLVTGDTYDDASQLGRPGAFRLNIGVGKETYRSLSGPQPGPPGASGVVDTGHDFTAHDRVMPHPIYAPMSWVCVLNPGETTFETLRPFLAEAYQMAVNRHANRVRRGAGG